MAMIGRLGDFDDDRVHYRDGYYTVEMSGLSQLQADLQNLMNMSTEDKLAICWEGALAVQKRIKLYLSAHHHRTGELGASFTLDVIYNAVFVRPGKTNKVVNRKKHAGTRTWKRRTSKIHSGSGRTTDRIKPGNKSAHRGPGNTMDDIAAYLHYGTVRMKPTHWFNHTMNLATPDCYAAMEKALDEYFASKGF